MGRRVTEQAETRDGELAQLNLRRLERRDEALRQVRDLVLVEREARRLQQQRRELEAAALARERYVRWNGRGLAARERDERGDGGRRRLGRGAPRAADGLPRALGARLAGTRLIEDDDSCIKIIRIIQLK